MTSDQAKPQSKRSRATSLILIRSSGSLTMHASEQDLLDQVSDLQAELRGSETIRQELESRCDILENQLDDAVDEIKIQHIQVYKYKMYQAKAEFLEKESAIHLERLQNEVCALTPSNSLPGTPTDDDARDINELLKTEGASVELVSKLKAKLSTMAQKTSAAQRELAELKKSGSTMDQQILEMIGDGATKRALAQIMGRFKEQAQTPAGTRG